MVIDLDIIETIEARRLNLFGHLKECRMRDDQGRYGNGLHPLEEKKEDLNIHEKWASKMQRMQEDLQNMIV